jgi:hypothetical protein
MAGALPRFVPLVALGSASMVVDLLAFLQPFPLADWWQHARLDYAWLTQYTLSGQLRFVGAFLLLFALYHWAFLLLRASPERGPLPLILAVQLGLGLALVGIYPIAAIDLYDYLLYGRLGLYWGANPLAHPPSQFPAEPMVAYSYWPNEPSVYGPLWQIVSQWLTAAVDGRLPDGLYAFKLLAVGASLLTTVLIWATLRRLRPGLAPAGALLYGWNPLQQFETAGNGHNDALMVLFLALALLLVIRGPRPLALPALGAGLLVKVTLAPLVPLFALAPLLGGRPWSERWRQLGLGLALAALLVGAFYAPYWEGRASLPFLDRGNWFTASPPTLLRELFRRWQEFETAGKTAATISAALFGLVALALLARLGLRERSAPEASAADASIRTGYHLFFAYLVLACLWWQPWYLLVLLVFAALSGDRALADRANLFCLGGLLSYPVFKYVWAVHQADWHLDYLKIMAVSVVAIFTLPLLHLAVSVRATREPRVARGSAGPPSPAGGRRPGWWCRSG